MLLTKGIKLAVTAGTLTTVGSSTVIANYFHHLGNPPIYQNWINFLNLPSQTKLKRVNLTNKFSTIKILNSSLSYKTVFNRVVPCINAQILEKSLSSLLSVSNTDLVGQRRFYYHINPSTFRVKVVIFGEELRSGEYVYDIFSLNYGV